MPPRLIQGTPTLSRPLRIAIAGLGRMGSIHAHHAFELAGETGLCELVAISTSIPAQAEQFLARTGTSVPVFSTIEDLAAAKICDATIIATNTALHHEHATLMLNAQQRVFLEKPLTGTLDGDRKFVAYLQREHPLDVMLGFQRRFDPALQFAKQLLDTSAIGRLFKIYSALEDSVPAPNEFKSPGLLPDMGIHNVDEILWLSGRFPRSAMVVGSRIYSHRLTQCAEDFDDAILLLDFDGTPGDEMAGEVQVGRNHVSGYRSETLLYGENGQICVGRFRGNSEEVLVEVYGRRPNLASPVASRSFPLRTCSDPLPEFANRFGAAYKEELRVFIKCCLNGNSFPTTQLDGLRAQEVIEAGMSAIVTRNNMAEIRYGH